MKKRSLMLIVSIVLFMMLLIIMSTKSKAATEKELEEYLFEPHEISGVKYIIRDSDKVKLQRFFSERDLTDSEATEIKNLIDGAIDFMTADGATEPNKISTVEKKTELFSYAHRMASILGLTVTYDSTETRLDFYDNGTLVESIFWGVIYKEDGTQEITTESKLVKTGSSNYIYIIIPIIVLIAGTMILISRKKLKDE